MNPSATGTLAATPLAHALIYARHRRLTGRLELVADDQKSAVISLWQGAITAVETTPIGLCPGGFFGAVVYELGYIDSAILDVTLMEIAKTKRLHGEVLLERGAITVAQRDEALVEQIHRKVHHLFSFVGTTTYAFFDAKALSTSPEPPVAVDCVGPVWRGIRDFPPAKFVEETVRRVGTNTLRATKGGSARLPPAETALTQALAAYPMTLEEMKVETELPPARVELLVYLLVIAKCVEAVSGVRTHPSTGALPVSMPSGPVNKPSSPSLPTERIEFAAPPSSGRLPITPGSSSRLPATPGSSPRLPAVPESSPRHQAVPGAAATGATLAPVRAPIEFGVDGIHARAEAVESESYFDVLGVPADASPEAVRAAFMRLAKVWHPDRVPAGLGAVRDDVVKIFAHMTRAHHTLCDKDARGAYLLQREAAHPTRQRRDVVRDILTSFQNRQFELSVQFAKELTARSEPDDAEALALEAWASVHCGEADEEALRAALPKLDRAVNTDRTNDHAVYYRGLLQKRLNNLPSAFRDFARAVQLNPDNIDAERELRIFAMRVRKGSGEHKMIAPLLDKLNQKK